jgi:hypothetical protein
MSTKLDFENFKFWYSILSLKDFDYKFFLKSDDPATKVFAILANFEKDGEDKAIENIVHEVKISADGNLQQSHFYNQIKVLARLRNDNINLKLNDMISSVETFIHDEDYLNNVDLDLFYKRLEIRAQKKTVIRMKELGYSAEQIAQITSIPIEKIEMM